MIGLTTTFPSLDDCDALIPDLRSVRVATPPDGWALRLAVEPEQA